jgi:hypothetical protein
MGAVSASRADPGRIPPSEMKIAADASETSTLTDEM